VAIDGKVATVLSNYEVAFNVGSDQGVQTDDIATVFEQVAVNDPDTGESLGTVMQPRIRFKIQLVESRMSVGRSYESVVDPSAETGGESLKFWVITIPRGTTRKVTDDRDRQDWATVFLAPGYPVQIVHPKPPQPAPAQSPEEESG
jgi:hypothetical protein